MSKRDLSRFWILLPSSAFSMSPSAFSFRSASAKPRLRILQRELLLLALHAREKFARHCVELRPPDVVARLRHVRLRLLLLNAELRARLADFFFRLFELRAPVVERALDAHRIELDDDIAFLDGHAVRGELEESEGRRHPWSVPSAQPNASPSLRRAPAGSR